MVVTAHAVTSIDGELYLLGFRVRLARLR